MTNNKTHKLLDDLMEEVKDQLVAQQINTIKEELLGQMEIKQDQFIKDVVDICDKIFGEFVQASQKRQDHQRWGYSTVERFKKKIEQR